MLRVCLPEVSFPSLLLRLDESMGAVIMTALNAFCASASLPAIAAI